MNEAGYQTLIVKFGKPITELDGIFDDAEAWGVETLQGKRIILFLLSFIHLSYMNIVFSSY